MLGAGAAIAGLAVVSVKAASDLGESLNKARVVFEGASDDVVSFSENTAESMGIAQSAALDAAAGFGAMAQSAGLSEQASADMSVELVQLAADMASFNNQDPSEMLERLRSGLAGEAEPLRRFGVFISEARVQTEAYASGIARAGEELTDAQKVQARFNIIMQDTAKQQGDFARTVGESLPNQMRVLKARAIDLAAAFGQILLPAALKIAEALNFLLTPLIEAADLLERLGTFEPPQAQIEATTSWAAAARELSDAWRAGEISSAAYEEGLRMIGARFAGDQPVIIRQVEHYLALRDSWDEAAQGAKNLEGAAKDTGKAMEEAGKRGRVLGKELRESLAGELPAIVGTVVKYKEAFSLSPNELKRITETWAEIGRTMARDLREILNSDLTPTMKAGIAALPPEMRHAWVEGNERQRAAIQASLRTTFNLEETISRLVNSARRGGGAVGAALADGIKLGITTRSETVAIEAAQMVHRAIEAAKTAARARSPSLEMIQLGRDMALGLVEGFIKEQEKVADKWRGMLENLLSTARSFRDSIRSGFASLLDISGAFGTEEAPATPESIAAFFSQQQATAEQFAHILQALRRQGASRRLLSEIGAAGPEAIPFAQALLQGGPQLIGDVSESLKAIAGIAGDISEQLTKSFFGSKLDEVRDQLKQENEKLREANHILRQIEAANDKSEGDIVLTVDGQELARILRNQLNRIGSRNATTGLKN